MACKFVTIISLVVFLELVSRAENLSKSDPGVCEEDVRVGKFVEEPFNCGNRRRPKICKRMIKKWVLTTQTICCIEWKFYKGKCIPEGPVCEQPCVNAKCTDNNNCTCAPGLVHLNETHCGPSCDEGYYNDLTVPELTCKSKCSQPCINGECKDFDVCSCNEGYRFRNDSKFECDPVCDACQHGVCVGPNNCSCHDGYAKNGSDVCTPVCTQPCTNGYCSAPDKCECNPGYSFAEIVSDVCTPDCTEPCTNGYCSAPDKCECNPGYSFAEVKTDGTNETRYTTCELIPLRNCRGCEATCNDTVCACANGTLCVSSTEEAIVAPTTTLAGLQLTWMLGAALGILLIILVLVIIHRTWRLRREYERKTKENEYQERDCVMFTRPDTLIRQKYQEDRDDRESDIDEEGDYDEVETKQTNLDLLPRAASNDYVDRV